MKHPLLLLVLVLWSADALAQAGVDSCTICSVQSVLGPASVTVTAGQGMVSGVRAIRRVHTGEFSEGVQGLALFTDDARGLCLTSIANAMQQDMRMLWSDLGGGGGQHELPLLPAREFVPRRAPSTRTSMVELGVVGGWAGGDTSRRSIGVDNTWFGAQVLVAPLGALLSRFVSLHVGGGVISEGGRLRFPLLGQLRFTLPCLANRISDTVHFMPDSCALHDAGTRPPQPDPAVFTESTRSPRVDSTSLAIHIYRLEETRFKAFLYVEGGMIVDGSFDGNASAEVINPGDRRDQMLFGAGGGISLGNVALMAGYRWMELQLATPCPTCQERRILNTNAITSLVITLAYRFPW